MYFLSQGAQSRSPTERALQVNRPRRAPRGPHTCSAPSSRTIPRTASPTGTPACRACARRGFSARACRPASPAHRQGGSCLYGKFSIIGKTRLAQAYGHECCLRGLKTYYLKATELRDRLSRAVERGNASKVIGTLVKPSCLIIDEVGRCVFDKECTDLISGAGDRRHGKEAPNTLILTSNVAPSGWDEFFTGDDTLLCASGRVSGKASVLVMRGPSFRGRGLDTFSVEALPQAIKQRGAQPTML